MTVEPIRDKKRITAMQTYLKGRRLRDWLLFNVGINTGLRVGDMLNLKVEDVLTAKGTFRQHLILKEEKTGKEKKIKLNNAVKKYIKTYLQTIEYNQDTYLFQSRKGNNRPITRVQAYRELKSAASCVGIENFGTHSMRKTWGYWSYRASRYNIGLIMDTFNHSSPVITLRYIGISQDQKDELYSAVEF